MWYLAEPSEVKYLDTAEVVFEKGRFSVKKWQGIFFLLVDAKYLIAEKRNKVEMSDDEIRIWIQNVRKKDRNKIEKTRGMIKEAELFCQRIEGIWKE